ncbi:MAG: Putative two-component response regulator [uncultured Sulfurovum sp.]|uniref:Two-component response regulator n=1 Tax=uncultured Sulfurovum sp. TaxID=269237 RepID=A0A6S6SUY0_9BACT|nr:MAG: Putative two-component response regulator [uncultured Sulfurovum sp.]
MQTLKLNKLIFSGQKNEVLKLNPYFKEIIYLKNNQEILTFPLNEPKIIFLNCDEKNNTCINIIKEIRQEDRKSIIVITSKEKNQTLFVEALSLHLSGYLQKPFKKDDIEALLANIVQDLAHLSNDKKIQLKEGYSFNIEQLTLFDDKYNIIKLTKNETKLMQVLSNEKNNYIRSETIEYSIWEEASLEQDCNQRLKHLIYCLRKKLPKGNLINAYNLGYKFISY